MREFVYGTAAQFNALDHELSSGKIYKFANRRLPPSCSKRTACIWFAKVNDTYTMMIDKGISTSAGDQTFIDFLDHGEAKFASMDDLVAYLHSLKPLFQAPVNDDGGALHPDPSCTENAPLPMGTPDGSTESARPPVLDKEKLQAIQASQNQPRMVWPEELASRLKEKVFGQDNAIDALADKVVINQMRKDKRLLTIAFVGPTATGKSETAKSLADVMTAVYGSNYGYIEIAGSEFIGEHTVHRFLGAPPGYIGHGQPTILDPVRKNPRHVIVINEVEKANESMLIGLMEAIDTGMLGMADNTAPIDLRQCILLFTSNIPMDIGEYDALPVLEQAEMCRDAFTKHCGRPEISGKITNFLVFRPLSDEATTDIIIKFIREELSNFNLELAHIDEHLMAEFLKHQTKYGARGIRGLINDSVGRHLLRTRKFGALKDRAVTMKGSINHIEFELAEMGSEDESCYIQ